MQQADTGTKMIHIGEGTSSTIISKGISAGSSKNAYRGLVRMARTAKNAKFHNVIPYYWVANVAHKHTPI